MSYGIMLAILGGVIAAAMGGVDCVVFTAGIGENVAHVRNDIATNLEFMGIKIDEEKNNNLADVIADISAKDSRVKVLVIPTNEEQNYQHFPDSPPLV